MLLRLRSLVNSTLSPCEIPVKRARPESRETPDFVSPSGSPISDVVDMSTIAAAAVATGSVDRLPDDTGGQAC